MATVAEILEEFRKATEALSGQTEALQGAVKEFSSALREVQAAQEASVRSEEEALVALMVLEPKNRKALEEMGLKRVLEEAETLAKYRFGVEKGIDSSDLVLPEGIVEPLLERVLSTPILQRCSRVQVTALSGKIPFVGGAEAQFVAEGAALPEVEPGFTSTSYALNILGLGVPITKVAAGSLRGLTARVMRIFQRGIATKLEKAVLTGSGTGEPLGVYNVVPSGNVVDGTDQDLNAIFTAYLDGSPNGKGLAAQFRGNAVWVMNSATLLKLATKRDTQGQYYLTPSLSAETAGTLLGRPVFTSEALGNDVIVFFDPEEYMILQGVDVNTGKVQAGVDIEDRGKTLASTLSVYVYAWALVDGRVFYQASTDEASDYRPVAVITNFLAQSG